MRTRFVLILIAVAIAYPTRALRAVDEAADLARLSLEVQRAEDIRAVKRLQISYAHFAQFGLWSEMASLFTSDAEAIYGAEPLKGRAAIRSYLLTTWGNGREGLPAGGLHTMLEDAPVLNLSADGKTAKGRWREFAMIGQLGANARWDQGISQVDYVKEDGIWKIARLHYHQETAGPYENGWVTGGRDIKLVPFHYTSAEAGVPIPPIPDGMPIPAITGTPSDTIATLDRRIQAMNDEDKVANLQNAYGYYVDRKMWDDAIDLFASDAVLELADVGIYEGVASIRRFHERSGPQGLRYGQMNNRLIFNLLVSVSTAGREARTRGVVFNMLGDYTAGTASLGIDVIENRFAKGADGIWRIREMRIFPIMATDYYQGWARSRLVTAPEIGEHAPDKPAPAADRGTLTDGVVPDFFLNHPVTGKPVQLPSGTKVAGVGALLPALAAVGDVRHSPRDMQAAIADARRRLSHSVAYIAVDNISHALANDIDHQQWHALGQLFAKDGWRAKSAVAFCVGPDHAEECERNYDGVAALPRQVAAGHWLIQPVIDVAPDGTSAKMRHRLLHIDAAPESRGFSDGMYPNNAAKLEDGIWKLDVMAPDQPYFSSPSFKDGWARKASASLPRPVVKNAIEPLRNFPPDIPRSSMPLRHHGSLPGNTIVWPDIKPMWFAYRNPVSGRVPPLYCPDLKTCERDLAASAQVTNPIRPDQSAFREIFRELVETNTTLSAGSCTLAAERMAVRLRAAGFADSQLTLFTTPEHPKEGGLVAVYPGTSKTAKPLLLIAHIDVVEARREDWERDPFTMVEENGYFFGRGTADTKALAAVWVDTLIRFKQQGHTPARTLKVALTCGEETNGAFNGIEWLAANRRELIDAEFALNEGGGGDTDGKGKVVGQSVQVGEKTFANFRVETRNPGGHSSTPVRDNAIYQLSRALLKIDEHEFPLEMTETTQQYFSEAGAARKDEIGKAMVALAANPRDKAAEAIVNTDRSLHSNLRTTCVATLLDAGHAVNALPQRANANVNCRIFPGHSIEDIGRELSRVIGDPGVSVTAQPPVRPSPPAPPLHEHIIGPMQKLAARYWPGIPVIPSMSNGYTDATFLGAVGIPTYGAPGMWNDPDGNGTHGLNERIEVRSVYVGRDYLFDLVKAYAD